MRQSSWGLILVVVAALGGAALLLSDLGDRKGQVVVVDALSKLGPTSISGLAIRVEGTPPEEAVTLAATKDGWTMPGNWPIRQSEARELVELVGNLRTRFAPEKILEDKELKKRGLKPAQVELKATLAAGGDIKLELGEEESTAGNSFSRPVWARLDGSSEVLRLSPGTLAVLKRPASFYRQRRLFAQNQEAARKAGVRQPNEAGPSGAPVLAKSLELNAVVAPPADQKDALNGSLRLDRAEPAAGNPAAGAAAWRVSSPDGKERLDFLDPATGDAVLAAVPEIWAERFYFGDTATPQKTGLDKPERTLVVTDLSGNSIKLLIGKKSRERAFKRLVQATPPPGLPPGMQLPPREEVVKEEFVFAQLADNPQVFEVRADRVNPVFLSRAKLRDPKLARFKTSEVEKVQINGTSQTAPVVLLKKEGKWRIEAPYNRLADGAKVESLLGKLEGLDAKDTDVEEPATKDLPAALAAAGLDKPVARFEITVREADQSKAPPAEGDSPKTTRQIVYELGNLDAMANKINARSEGLPRINKVDNGLKDQPENQIATVVSRKAGDYRSTQLFDLDQNAVTGITIERAGKKTVLKRQIGKPWMVEAPAGEADAAEVDKLLSTVLNARSADFVADNVPATKQAAEFGLGADATSVTLAITPEGKPAQMAKLVLGKDRVGKPGAFGRAEIDGNAGGNNQGEALVVALQPEVRKALDREAMAFVPKSLWSINEKEVVSVTVRQPDGAEFKLVPQPPAITPNVDQPMEEPSWKIQGPFDSVTNIQAQALVRALLSPAASSWLSLTDDKLPERGLDKPLTLKVELKSGPARILMLGKEDPTTKQPVPAEAVPGAEIPALGRFAKVEGKPGVLVVDGALARAVSRTALELVPMPSTTLDAARILKVDFKKPVSSFSIERSTRGGWQLIGLGDFSVPADEDRARKLEETIASIRILKLAAFGKDAETKAKDFGLDKPILDSIITLKPVAPGKPNEIKRIRLGTQLADKSGSYARFDEDQSVVVLDPAAVVSLSANANDYLSRNLLPKEKLSLTRVARSGKAGELVIEKLPAGWKTLKPEGLAIDGSTLSYLLESLDGLDAQSADGWQPTWIQADLAKFGLDLPEATWIFEGTLNGKPLKRILQVGKVADPARGTRFARADGPLVGRIPPEIANKLVAPTLFFQDRIVAKVPGIREAKVTSAGRALTFRFESDRWKVTQPVQAETDPSLAAWLGQFGQLRAGEWLAKKDTPEERKALGLDKPVTRWELFAEGGKSLGSLDLAAPGLDGFSVAAFTNGPSLFKLDAVQTRQAQSEYRIRQVFDPPFDPTRVRRITITPADSKPFTLLQVGTGWFVEAEPAAKPDPNTVKETLTALSNLRLVRFVTDKGGKPADYGLDKPFFALELGANRLLLGKPVSDASKDRYATMEGVDAGVFVIDERSVELLARPLARFALPPKEAPTPAPAPVPGAAGFPGGG